MITLEEINKLKAYADVVINSDTEDGTNLEFVSRHHAAHGVHRLAWELRIKNKEIDKIKSELLDLREGRTGSVFFGLLAFVWIVFHAVSM